MNTKKCLVIAFLWQGQQLTSYHHLVIPAICHHSHWTAFVCIVVFVVDGFAPEQLQVLHPIQARGAHCAPLTKIIAYHQNGLEFGVSAS